MSDDPGEERDDDRGAGRGDDRTADGVEHLRAAAREMIAAVRAFLEVAEELVEDPKAVERVVDTVGSLTDAARRSSGERRDDGGSDDGVEHIRVT